ncbi:hypothetical protein [Dactylosporangium sp. CA-139066]
MEPDETPDLEDIEFILPNRADRRRGRRGGRGKYATLKNALRTMDRSKTA